MRQCMCYARSARWAHATTVRRGRCLKVCGLASCSVSGNGDDSCHMGSPGPPSEMHMSQGIPARLRAHAGKPSGKEHYPRLDQPRSQPPMQSNRMETWLRDGRRAAYIPCGTRPDLRTDDFKHRASPPPPPCETGACSNEADGGANSVEPCRHRSSS